MKFCYIISTCNKYIDTRVKYQMETMLKNVNNEDIFYLTSTPNIEQRQFGWYTMDHVENITWKYIYFIHNMNISNYDWYIFIDDDTFVFEKRLQNLLSQYDSNECYYIGKELNHITSTFCSYMSGGGGYAISNRLYSHIVSYIKQKGINESYYSIINTEFQPDDLCMGMWIQDIAKENKINKINNDLFNMELHKDFHEIHTAITFHKVTTKEQYELYYSVSNNVSIEESNNVSIEIVSIKDTTVFVLISDANYFNKAKRTIVDLRSKGNWQGDIVLITIDFNLNANFKDFYNITEVTFQPIDKSILLAKIGKHGFSDTTDKREINKLNQWEKLHVFDDYFMKWSRVVYLDAGLRVLDEVSYLLQLDYKNKLLAPKDGKLYDDDQEFKCQLSYDKPELIDELKNIYGDNILNSNYMLNCIWIYDTNILHLCDKNQLIEAMNKYSFCKTNEMGIMNIMFHFKYHLWVRLPMKSSNGKILFDWCELNNDGTHWKDYCYIKYPVTISFDDC